MFNRWAYVNFIAINRNAVKHVNTQFPWIDWNSSIFLHLRLLLPTFSDWKSIVKKEWQKKIYREKRKQTHAAMWDKSEVCFLINFSCTLFIWTNRIKEANLCFIELRIDFVVVSFSLVYFWESFSYFCHCWIALKHAKWNWRRICFSFMG